MLLPESLLQSVLDQLPESAVIVFDHDLRVKLAAGRALPTQPFNWRVAPGERLPEIMPDAYVAAFEAAWQAALTGESHHTDFLFAGQGYRFVISPLLDANGVPASGMIMSRLLDQSEPASNSVVRYRALFDQTNDAVFIFDLVGNPLSWNKRAAEMLGYAYDEFARVSMSDVIPPDEREESRVRFRALMAGEEVPVYERRLRHKDGTYLNTEINLTLVRDDVTGEPICTMSVARDITERKQVETAIRLNEERYRTISEIISDFAYAFRVEPDGTLVQEWMTEESFRRITGWSSAELLREGYQVLYHADDLALLNTNRDEVLAGKQVTDEYRIITRDGRLRWLLVERFPVWDEAEQRVVRFYGAAQDITERKEVELALRRSEERFRQVASVISDGVYDWDMVNNITWHSESYHTMFGVQDDPKDSFFSWYERIHPDDRDTVVESQAEAIRLGAEDWSKEYRMRRLDGVYAIVTDHAVIMRDAAGRPVRLIGAVADITEHKAAEQHALDLAVQTEKVLLMSEFITAISHDFRTPLSIINTSSYLLFNTPRREDSQRHFEKLREQVDRIEQLVDSLLMMARLDGDSSLIFEHLDVNQLVDYTAVSKRSAYQAKQQNLNIDCAPDLPFVQADRQWLIRALTNLLDNAIRYSPVNQSIRMLTYRRETSIVVEIQDNGIGMSDEQLLRIFDPLYRVETHRPMTGGHGLGLTIARKIAERHHGGIEINSALNQGTTVRLWLPVPQPN
ncbi:MAG: hypothetical protein CL610_27250 [Anaerolineaceae bacterium]|nr:hypothetical protein [Anaerolineaceae bacterium]